MDHAALRLSHSEALTIVRNLGGLVDCEVCGTLLPDSNQRTIFLKDGQWIIVCLDCLRDLLHG